MRCVVCGIGQPPLFGRLCSEECELIAAGPGEVSDEADGRTAAGLDREGNVMYEPCVMYGLLTAGDAAALADRRRTWAASGAVSPYRNTFADDS